MLKDTCTYRTINPQYDNMTVNLWYHQVWSFCPRTHKNILKGSCAGEHFSCCEGWRLGIVYRVRYPTVKGMGKGAESWTYTNHFTAESSQIFPPKTLAMAKLPSLDQILIIVQEWSTFSKLIGLLTSETASEVLKHSSASKEHRREVTEVILLYILQQQQEKNKKTKQHRACFPFPTSCPNYVTDREGKNKTQFCIILQSWEVSSNE